VLLWLHWAQIGDIRDKWTGEPLPRQEDSNVFSGDRRTGLAVSHYTAEHDREGWAAVKRVCETAAIPGQSRESELMHDFCPRQIGEGFGGYSVPVREWNR
jgi:hypothetical protein